MEQVLRAFSTFSGITALSVALRGLPVKVAAFAEIDPFNCHLLHERCGASRPKYMPSPDEPGITAKEARARQKAIDEVADLPEHGLVPNYGDISQITVADLVALGPIDLLEGGSPCQAFSAAGKRAGLNDPRGQLMLAFTNLSEMLREHCGLQFTLWENVEGVLDDKTNGFGHLLGALAGYPGSALVPAKRGRWSRAGHLFGKGNISVAWRVQGAEFHGLAQRRKRVFALQSFGAVDAGEVLFEPHGVQLYEEPPRPSAEWQEEPEAAGSAAGDGAGFGYPLSPVYGITDYSNVAVDIMPTLQARKGSGGRMDAVVYALNGYGSYRRDGLPCLRRTGGDNGHGSEALVVVQAGGFSRGNSAKARGIGWTPEGTPPLRAGASGTNQVPTVAALLANTAGAVRWVVRRLTPVECERLMGFPDGWTAIPFRGKREAADTNRYQSLGNSMATTVVRWIAKRLLAAIDAARSATPGELKAVG